MSISEILLCSTSTLIHIKLNITGLVQNDYFFSFTPILIVWPYKFLWHNYINEVMSILIVYSIQYSDIHHACIILPGSGSGTDVLSCDVDGMNSSSDCTVVCMVALEALGRFRDITVHNKLL